jgi:hypothetical protein
LCQKKKIYAMGCNPALQWALSAVKMVGLVIESASDGNEVLLNV